MLVLSQIGQSDILQRFLKQALDLRLFQNDVTPVLDSTAQTFDEADFLGYSSVAMIGSGWEIQVGPPIQAIYSQQVFQSNARQLGQQIYGYYVTRSDGALLWSERFPDGPYFITNEEDAIRVTPRLEIRGLIL